MCSFRTVFSYAPLRGCMAVGIFLCWALLLAGPRCWAARPEDHRAQKTSESQQRHENKGEEAVGFPLPCRFTIRDSETNPTVKCSKYVNLFLECKNSVINTEIKVPGYSSMRNVGTIEPGKHYRLSICNADSEKDSQKVSKKVKLVGNIEGGQGGIGEAYAEEVVLKAGSLPCKLSTEKIKTDDGSDGLRLSALCTKAVYGTCMTTGLRETCFKFLTGKNLTLRTFANKDLDATETVAQLVGLYDGADGLQQEGLSNAVPLKEPEPAAKKKEAPVKASPEQGEEEKELPEKSGATGRRLCVALRVSAATFAAAVLVL